MNVQEARDKIKELEDYIELVEGYETGSFERGAIKSYALLENVTEVATILNGLDYIVGNRKVLGKDVSDIIRSKPTDEFHEMAKKMFKGNNGRAKRRGWF